MKSRKSRKVEPVASVQSSPDPNSFYDERQTAPFLRLRNYRTLATWRWQGRYPELKFNKVGRKVLYSGESILAFLRGDAKPPARSGRKRGAR